MNTATFTAVLEKEGDMYVALCPELDVASQGKTVEEATANLKEAVELFLETADLYEIKQRLKGDVQKKIFAKDFNKFPLTLSPKSLKRSRG